MGLVDHWCGEARYYYPQLFGQADKTFNRFDRRSGCAARRGHGFEHWQRDRNASTLQEKPSIQFLMHELHLLS